MDLKTNYLGLKLRTPLVCAASPLSREIDNLKRMEDAGASAVVLHSLFEEQLRQDNLALNDDLERGALSTPEASSYFPEPSEFHLAPEQYLEHIQRAKKALRIPVIASLNGCSRGGWVGYAREMQNAGADAIELNIYNIPTDTALTSGAIEAMDIDIARSVKSSVTIPVSVKLSPFFTNFANIAARFQLIGADGLVLFNRFYQPDIDLETMEVRPNILPSTPMAMRLPLRWIAILHGSVALSLAASGGVHRGADALKLLLVGADVTMLCSALLRRGIEHLGVVERELVQLMEQHEYESVSQLKGSMSQKKCADPAAYERAQYMRGLIRHPGFVPELA